MSEKIVVPILGESITEATVSKWLKNEGDSVEADEPIVELETDKVNLEVPSPIGGVLSKINFKDGLMSSDIEVLFIRAPKIDKINKDVEVLATFQEEVVAVRQGIHIGISCHPELLNETLIHEICFKGKNEIS